MSYEMDAEMTLPYTVPAELVGRHFATLSPDEWHAVRQYQYDHNLCLICGQDHDCPNDYGYYGSFYLPCTGPVDRHPSFRNYACAKAGEVPDNLVGTLYVHMNNSGLREVYWHRMNTGRCVSCGTADHLIDDCTPDTRTRYFRKKHWVLRDVRRGSSHPRLPGRHTCRGSIVTSYPRR